MKASATAAQPTFEQGLKEGRLLFQHCTACGVARHPPAPFCAACRSWDASFRESSGVATLHSFTIVERAAYPGVPVPHIIGLMDMADGVRVIAPVRMNGEPRIGMAMRACFDTLPPSTLNLLFEPAATGGDG